jgi:hypothetical protein
MLGPRRVAAVAVEGDAGEAEGDVETEGETEPEDDGPPAAQRRRIEEV